MLHVGNGAFCYSFVPQVPPPGYPDRSPRGPGNGDLERVTVLGPGVTPNVAVIVPNSLVDVIGAAMETAGVAFGYATRRGLEEPVTLVPVATLRHWGVYLRTVSLTGNMIMLPLM